MASAADDHQPRIYVACLAAYNHGILHGAWIEADQDAWAIHDEVAAMLQASPILGAEEWAIHDYEGFAGVRLSEGMGFDAVADLAAFIVAHGRLGAALLDYCGDLSEARQALEDRYHGAFEGLADYMRELTENTVCIPDALRYYIDYEAMARDAELGGELMTVQTAPDAVHVFAGW